MAGVDGAAYAWVERVLGVRVATAGAPAGAAMKLWQEKRAATIAALKLLQDQIVTSEDPEAPRATILIQAIIKNLTPEPATLQSVIELERYVTEDDIIQDVERPNPFGVDVQVRAALLPAITQLREQYAGSKA